MNENLSPETLAKLEKLKEIEEKRKNYYKNYKNKDEKNPQRYRNASTKYYYKMKEDPEKYAKYLEKKRILSLKYYNDKKIQNNNK